MPPKRRASGPTNKAQQSTLAFHGSRNKVTKPTTRASNVKKNTVLGSTTETKKLDVVDVEAIVKSKPTTVEADIIDQIEKEVAAENTPEENEAQHMTQAAITKYWISKEKSRRASRAHQEGLSLQEKILREFDMSAQYGPCTGIARIKRWKRAHRLELAPPIEVLAVLLKVQGGKDQLSVQRSHVDEILNARTDIDG